MTVLRRWAIRAAILFALASQSIYAQTDAPSTGSKPTRPPVVADHSATEPSSNILPPQTAQGMRAFLRIYGVDDAKWSHFDDAAWTDDQQTVLMRILYRLPRVEPYLLQQWSEADWQFTDLQMDSSSHRGDVFRVAGRVVGVEPIPLPTELAERLEFAEVYQLLMQLPAGQRVSVIARAIPMRWLGNVTLNEFAQIDAVFLKDGMTPQGGEPMLLFAGEHARWWPNQVRPELDVGEEAVFLASMGVDIGRFQQLKEQNRKPLQEEDRESFYELLSAMHRVDEATLENRADSPLDLGALLQTPAASQGKVFELRGTVRRATRVRVGDQDLQSRFGLNEYYQLDLFVPLKNQIIRFANQNSTEEAPTFDDAYPVTVCVVELPEGMSEGTQLSVQVRISAVFFKLWVYRSRYMASFDDGQLQVSPMFLAPRPQVLVRQQASKAATSLALGCLFLMLMGGLWLVLWRTTRKDDRIQRDLLRRRNQT